ncbi:MULTISPECIES: amidohydrolase [Thermocrispum]|uniref:Amidohydrolase n=2 Tax=Thermocrispum agreste TaxID=37925 RepID=A0ABD6FKD2_9PSEU|nr:MULTISPECIES: amidohydrolase [Thermocrispum]
MASTKAATTLLTGGRIYSPAAPDATAMAITGDTIVWVGQDGPGRALHPDAEEVPLDGAFVTPGFVDAHVHATASGLHQAGADLTGARGAQDVLALLRKAAERTPPEGVLVAHGWDESAWPDARLPSRAEIDDAVGGRPAYLTRIDVHSALVSTALVELAPHAREADGWSAEGPVRAEAHHVLRAAVRSAVTPQQRDAAQHAFLTAAAARGVVCVHECAGPDLSGWEDVAALLDKAGPGTPEVIAYWGELADDAVIDRAKRLGIRGLAGDLFVDGALGSHTARLRAPYQDEPDHNGRLYLDADDVAEHVVACTRAGLQAGFHVIGDGALDVVIEGFTRAEAEVGAAALAAGMHRLEHVEMIGRPEAEALARWNVTASVQPLFDELWGGPDGMYAQRLGKERAATLNPFSMLAATGVLLAGGSDSPVTPVDPWRSVRAAVHHRTEGSGISPRAAFTAHTKAGYRAAGVDDGISGTLVPGAPATYAVWEAGELVVAAPDPRVQRWSTDPRSRVPGLPVLEPGTPLPSCLRTVRRGVTIYAA